MADGKRYPSDDLAQILIRMPPQMRDELKVAAKANGRSASAEIVARLQEVEDLREGTEHQQEEILRLRAALKEERIARETHAGLTEEDRAELAQARELADSLRKLIEEGRELLAGPRNKNAPTKGR